VLLIDYTINRLYLQAFEVREPLHQLRKHRKKLGAIMKGRDKLYRTKLLEARKVGGLINSLYITVHTLRSIHYGPYIA
jgi:hypothetical protein